RNNAQTTLLLTPPYLGMPSFVDASSNTGQRECLDDTACRWQRDASQSELRSDAQDKKEPTPQRCGLSNETHHLDYSPGGATILRLRRRGLNLRISPTCCKVHEDRRTDTQRRIGSYQHTDQHRERKSFDGLTAERKQDNDHEDG